MSTVVKVFPPIDIIIPVYKGYLETVECLQSVISSKSHLKSRILIINDSSPDCALVEYLHGLKIHSNVSILDNDVNLGFVATVNRGIDSSYENDVILLNSDTKVSDYWIDKLYNCAYSEERIGTVTPFSNNATICSYPRFGESNQLPAGLSLDDINKIFERSCSKEVLDIPTGVGFCLYIKRDVLKQIGLFNVEEFGKGYGEENDFCMRAFKTGWRNVLCADTFVYHSGGVSFGVEQQQRMSEATTKIDQMHPEYDGMKKAFLASDPIRKLRIKADLERYRSATKPTILMVTHNMEGGTARHVAEMSAAWSDQGYPTFILKPYGNSIFLKSGDLNDSFECRFRLPDEYQKFLQLCRSLRIGEIHFHHLFGYHDLIKRLPLDLDVQYSITLHDYYFVCPRISFSTVTENYCGEPDEHGCSICLKKRPTVGSNDIMQWRNDWLHFLEMASIIFAPSQDTVDRYKRYFPMLDITMVPHVEKSVEKQRDPHCLTGERLQVAAIGALSRIKGADILYKCAEDAKLRRLPLDFTVIGYTWKQMKSNKDDVVYITGSYDEKDLIDKIKLHDIDCVFFPSICPETYSYTMSSAVLAGCPIVTTNIGAVAQRVKYNDIGWIVSTSLKPQQINDLLVNILIEKTEYHRKASNLSNVELTTTFPDANVFYKGIRVFDKNNVDFDVDDFILQNCRIKRTSIARKALDWLLKNKHKPILRTLYSIFGIRLRQTVKGWLK